MFSFQDSVAALNLWRRAHVAMVRKSENDLSMRQMCILLTVYTVEPPHTIRGMAEAMNIAKPAVTRAVDKLEMLGLVKRKEDPKDKRSILVQRTVQGSVFLTDMGNVLLGATAEASTP